MKRDRIELLADLCRRHWGEHYRSATWRLISNQSRYDWDGIWPVVDATGLLSGEIIDSESGEGYANVEDLAQVRIADLPAGDQQEIRRRSANGTWDGYANIPPLRAD